MLDKDVMKKVCFFEFSDNLKFTESQIEEKINKRGKFICCIKRNTIEILSNRLISLSKKIQIIKQVINFISKVQEGLQLTKFVFDIVDNEFVSEFLQKFPEIADCCELNVETLNIVGCTLLVIPKIIDLLKAWMDYKTMKNVSVNIKGDNNTVIINK